MNLLLTGAWQGAKENIATLEEMGHSVQFLQFEKDPLPCEYAWVEGVVCNGLFLYHDIELFKNLRYIQLTSAGYDRVPMDYIQSHGITVHNAAGVYSIPMAEYALWGVLTLYKQGRFFLDNQQHHRWEKHRGLLELAGKTVCILGCGSVGSECAKRFEAFGCNVLGVATKARVQEHFSAVHSMKSLSQVLPQADIVVLALPLTQETKGLFSKEIFEKMKEGAVFVNIARGAIADTPALLDALKTKLAGAVLDVFEEEPLSENSFLWNQDNVILTPHNSFVGENNQTRLVNGIFNNLKEVDIHD